MSTFFDDFSNQEENEEQVSPVEEFLSSANESFRTLKGLATEKTLSSVDNLVLDIGVQLVDIGTDISSISTNAESINNLLTDFISIFKSSKETESTRQQEEKNRAADTSRRGTIFDRLWMVRNEKTKKDADRKVLTTLEELGEGFGNMFDNLYSGIKELAVADFLRTEGGQLTDIFSTQVQEMQEARKMLGMSAQEWNTWNSTLMEEVNVLNDRFDNLFSAEDAYSAINTLIEAGVRDQDELQGMLEPMLKYQKGFGDLSAESLEWMKKYYREYGVDVLNSMGDQISYLSENFGVLPQELVSAFNDSSLVNSMMAYVAGSEENIKNSNEQLLGAITMLSTSDMQVDPIMSMMDRIMNLNDVSLGDDFAVSLEGFGIDVRGMRDSLREGNFMDETNKLINAIANAYESNPDLAQNLATVLGFDEDIMRDMVNMRDEANESYKDILSGIKDASGSLNDRLDAYPTTFVERLMNGISTSSWFQKVVETISGLGLNIQDIYFLLAAGKLVVGSVKDLVTLIGKIPGIGNIPGALASGASKALNIGAAGGTATLGTGGFLSAGLLATIGMAVGGGILAANDAKAGVSQSTSWLGEERGSSLRGKVESGIGGLLGGVGPGVFDEDANLVDTGTNILGGAGKGALIGGALGSIIPGLGTAIGAAIGGGVGAIGSAIGGEKIAQGLDWLSDRAIDIGSKAKESFDDAVDWVTEKADKALTDADRDITSLMRNSLGSNGVSAWNTLKDTGSNVVSIWKDDSLSFWEKMGASASTVISGTKEAGFEVLNGLKSKASEGLSELDASILSMMDESLGEHGVEAWNSLKQTGSDVMSIWQDDNLSLWEKVKSSGEEAFEGLGDFFSSLFDGVWEKIDSFFSSVKEKFSGVAETAGDIKDSAVDWASDTWEGIANAWGNLVSSFAEGSHRDGLTRVPHDGYRAILHKDEMVLPKDASDNLRDLSGDNITIGDVVHTVDLLKEQQKTQVPMGGLIPLISPSYMRQLEAAERMADNWESMWGDNNVVPNFQEYVSKVRPLLQLVESPNAEAAYAVSGEGLTQSSSDLLTWSGSHPFASYRITSPYGPRNKPTSTASSFHKGVDFGISGGTKVPAVEAGTAYRTHNSTSGNVVYLNADSGRQFVYMHQSNETFGLPGSAPGISLDKGQVISSIGSTREEMGSASTGPHLHFGYKPNGAQGDYADPMTYLNKYNQLSGEQKTESTSIENANPSIPGGSSDSQITDKPLYTWKFLRSKGVSEEGAAAITGTWNQESSISSKRIEGDYLSKFNSYGGYGMVDDKSEMTSWVKNVLFPSYKKSGLSINEKGYYGDGSGNSDKNLYPGLGIVQWTGPRAKNLISSSKSGGFPWHDLRSQLNYFWNEFTTKYNMFPEINEQSSVDQATKYFATKYEGSPSTNSYIGPRQAAAHTMYEKYQGTEPLTQTGTTQYQTADTSVDKTQTMQTTPTWQVPPDQADMIAELRRTTMRIERKLEEVTGYNPAPRTTKRPPATTVAQYG